MFPKRQTAVCAHLSPSGSRCNRPPHFIATRHCQTIQRNCPFALGINACGTSSHSQGSKTFACRFLRKHAKHCQLGIASATTLVVLTLNVKYFSCLETLKLRNVRDVNTFSSHRDKDPPHQPPDQRSPNDAFQFPNELVAI